MFYRDNTKIYSSHRATAVRPGFSPTWRLSALALLSAACVATHAGVTTRVSVDSEGREGVAQSYGGAISSDGRYVAFHSLASNLVPGDTNLAFDVLVHDRQAGITTRVSVDSAGVQGNRASAFPSPSADGRYVAFFSEASNLVSDDTNNSGDVFVHDRQTGQTTRASVNSAGGEGNRNSYFPVLSADGRYVAFYSEASNLVSGDTNDAADVFVHDRQTGQTTRVSVDSAGVQGNQASERPALSADGRYVAFHSWASNLAPDDTNDVADVFVQDRATGQTMRVSMESSGVQGDGDSYLANVSADGRYVAFTSWASNLTPNDTNVEADAFVYDRQTGQTARVSVDSVGGQGNGTSSLPYLSTDGRYVTFYSEASNLVSGDTNDYGDLFVRDRQTGETTRVSVATTGDQGYLSSHDGTMSGDGRYVAFYSDASTFVPGDHNGHADMFVHDRYTTLLEGPHGAANCSDGLDNDDNGYVDALDANCALPPAPRTCAGKLVTIVGTPGDDNLYATSREDVIAGLAGNDIIDGAGGNDVICGGGGSDTLLGNSGNDKVIGDGGNDRLLGGAGDDMLVGGSGNDRLNGGSGVDRCDGQTGTDTNLGGCEILLNTP